MDPSLIGLVGEPSPLLGSLWGMFTTASGVELEALPGEPLSSCCELSMPWTVQVPRNLQTHAFRRWCQLSWQSSNMNIWKRSVIKPLFPTVIIFCSTKTQLAKMSPPRQQLWRKELQGPPNPSRQTLRTSHSCTADHYENDFKCREHGTLARSSSAHEETSKGFAKTGPSKNNSLNAWTTVDARNPA